MCSTSIISNFWYFLENVYRIVGTVTLKTKLHSTEYYSKDNVEPRFPTLILLK